MNWEKVAESLEKSNLQYCKLIENSNRNAEAHQRYCQLASISGMLAIAIRAGLSNAK